MTSEPRPLFVKDEGGQVAQVRGWCVVENDAGFYELVSERALRPKWLRLLEDLYEWAEDAASQGTGTEYGTDKWDHRFISTWEAAEDLLPKVKSFLKEIT